MTDQPSQASDLLGAYAEANAQRTPVRRVMGAERSVLTWFELAVGAAIIALAFLVFTAMGNFNDQVRLLKKQNEELRVKFTENDRINGENVCRLIAATPNLGACSPPDKG